jgi:hypothetical protein
LKPLPGCYSSESGWFENIYVGLPEDKSLHGSFFVFGAEIINFTGGVKK